MLSKAINGFFQFQDFGAVHASLTVTLGSVYEREGGRE